MLNLSPVFKLKKISTNFNTSFRKKFIDNSTQTPTKLFERNMNTFLTNCSNKYIENKHNSFDYSLKKFNNNLHSEYNNFIINLIKSKEINKSTFVILKNFKQKFKIIKNKNKNIDNFIIRNNNLINKQNFNHYKSKLQKNFSYLNDSKLYRKNTLIKEIEEYKKKHLFDNLNKQNFNFINKNLYKNKIMQKIINNINNEKKFK